MQNQEEINTIRSVTNLECPHCQKNVLIGATIFMPSISAMKLEDVDKIKKELTEKISKMDISDDSKKSLIENINNESTVIFNEDVDEIINNIKTNDSSEESTIE